MGSKSDIEGVQAKNVKGYKMPDSNFIFSWNDGEYRKMVLASNTGEQIKNGFLPQPAATWKDPNTWEPVAPSARYTISNCKTVEESRSPSGNKVYARGKGQSCTDVCSKINNKKCLGEVSLIGAVKRSTSSSEPVGQFYTYD